MNFMTLLFCIFIGYLIYKAINNTSTAVIPTLCTQHSDCGEFLACLPDGICANPNDPTHCGVSDFNCFYPHNADTCRQGECFCGNSAPCENLTPNCIQGICVSEYDHDPENCGSFGNVCVESKCISGVCTCENDDECPTNTTCSLDVNKCQCNVIEQGNDFCALKYQGMAAKDTCCIFSINPNSNGCTSIQYEKLNCGGCSLSLTENVEGEVYCNDGVGACQTGTLTYCDNLGCVDLNTDTNNCGTCGNILRQLNGEQSICAAGYPSCLNNEKVYCDNQRGGCVSIETNKFNCGSCNNVCPDDLPNDKVGVCVNGNCQFEDISLDGG